MVSDPTDGSPLHDDLGRQTVPPVPGVGQQPHPAAEQVGYDYPASQPQQQSPPVEVETAFLTGPSDTALEDQRERVRLLMDRGALVVLLVAVITLFAAVVNTLRGNFAITHWAFPVVAGLMGVGLYYGAERMANRPQHAVEVPADLAGVLNDLTIARGEVIATAPRVLNPDELSSVLQDAQERQKAAFDAAAETLIAIRAGDMQRASALGTEVYRHTDVIEQVRNDLQQEWESSTAVPEGYLGDVGETESYQASNQQSYQRGPVAADPGYPATGYPAQPPQPASDPTRSFWSRPGSQPAADPSSHGGAGRSDGPASPSV